MAPRDCKQAPRTDDNDHPVCPRCGQRHAALNVASILLTPAQMAVLLASLMNAEARDSLRTWLQRNFPNGVPPQLQPLVEIVTRN